MKSVIEYADRMGIERLLVYLGMPPTDPDPSPDVVRRKNDETLEALRGWPDRARGLVYLNPKHGRFCLEEFDRCVRKGPMVGIKLWIAQPCSAPELDPIIEQAVELNALVYQHTWIKVMGNTPGESTPMDIAELARRHPNARLVCGHAGGDWERGIRAVRASQNVYLGVAGSEPTAGFIEMAVRELGAERVLYGSDVGGRSFASQLAKVLGAEISDEAKALILGENLRRVLTPIMQAKAG
jgi:predicted TIM-barrel fold metal-dependent hydrolase